MLVGLGFSWNLEISKHHFWIFYDFWGSKKKMLPGCGPNPSPPIIHPRWNHPTGEAWYLCRGSVRQNRYCCMEPYCHGGWYRMQHRILGSDRGGDERVGMGGMFFFVKVGSFFFWEVGGIFCWEISLEGGNFGGKMLGKLCEHFESLELYMFSTAHQNP